MKIKVPTKEIEVCDICQRETGTLTKCVRCGVDYCHICEAILWGCIHRPDLCRKCADIDSVVAVIKKYTQPLRTVLRARDAALRRTLKK